MAKIPCLIWLFALGIGSCASARSAEKNKSQPPIPVAAAVPVAAASQGRPSAQSLCESFPVAVGGFLVDLAPPQGFTEVCSKDKDICRELDSRYPPSVTTIGYFWVSGEWAARQRGESGNLSRYLIAQATSTTAGDFSALKRFVRERAGAIPDNSIPLEGLETVDRVDLGVIDESVDSISSGVILGSRWAPAQVVINTGLLLRGGMLALYVHQEFSDRRDIEVTKRLASDWRACLRAGAQGQVAQPARSVDGLSLSR